MKQWIGSFSQLNGSPLSIDAQRPSRPQDGQSPGHADAITHDIQFTSQDLPPSHRHLGHGDAGKLRQHEHLDIEDPALGMHVWYDVRQRRAREQLEPALRVLDRRSPGRRHQPQDQVERVHQEIAQLGPLSTNVSSVFNSRASFWI